jgi:hypothetical protein
MAEAFVKTFKRDYVRVSPIFDGATALTLIDRWMEDYNASPAFAAGLLLTPGSTCFPNPSRVRFSGVNSR